MSRGKPLEFSLVPTAEAWNPTGDPAGDERGSAYDPILRTLERNPELAVKVTQEDGIALGAMTPKDRDRIQAGLKTMANNRGTAIETRVTLDAVYARIK